MGINVGMLIFGLFDGGLAFCIVYCLLKAWFKGKTPGRILGIILGTLIFCTYIALFVWFNTPGVRVNTDFRNLIYAAPPVFAILLGTLVYLSQPPKPKKEIEVVPDETEDNDTEDESTATSETL